MAPRPEREVHPEQTDHAAGVRKMKQMIQKDDAVSPVIGVMLMLVVTIIIAAVVSVLCGRTRRRYTESTTGEPRGKGSRGERGV